MTEYRKRARWIDPAAPWGRRASGVRLLLLLLAGLLFCGAGGLSAAGGRQEGKRGDKPAVRKETRPRAAARPAARAPAPARKDAARHDPPRRVIEERPHARPAKPGAARRPEPRPRPDVRVIDPPGTRGRVHDVPPPALQDEGMKPPAPRRPAAPKEEGARGTLDRFRRDWVRGDSRSLSGLLSKRGRIRISIESSGIHDSFGRGQAQYVLQEYFGSTRSRQLAFSRLRVSSTDGESAYGVGKMKIRDRNTGKVRDRTVFVSMVPEDGTWAVREIRITD